MELCFQQQKQDFLSLMQLILQFSKCQKLIFLNESLKCCFAQLKIIKSETSYLKSLKR
jgi:hypothetical protein